MDEPVRLVIWDLDETFWHGTLTEGGITLRDDTREIVKELAQRGIVSSICSKNTFDDAAAVLRADGIWEYFVLPSIDWAPKGPRIAGIVEAIQLRPATVMFIDDNPINLEEARHLVPGIQTRSHEFIGSILADKLFKGKDDSALKRLQQYKLLEQRQSDAASAGGDVRDFLRTSNIRVRIEHDVAANLDRAVELINRTNQLNFTKLRLSEAPAQARTELLEQLSMFNVQAGLIGVRDNYGDHGWCGIYLLRDNATLLHFAFSCRILGMHVETWLYNRLGRPRLVVQGEVLTDVQDRTQDVDWVRLEDAAETGSQPLDTRLVSRIIARGGCDLMAVTHYFGLIAPEVIGEFNESRGGIAARLDHSIFLRQALDGVTEEVIDAAAKLGYMARDFQTTLTSDQTGADLWLLSFWTDATCVLYRHKDSGFTLPFGLAGYYARDVRGLEVEDLPSELRDGPFASALRTIKDEYDYIGLISEEYFKETVQKIFEIAKPETVICVVTATEYVIGLDGIGSKMRHCSQLNRWILEVAERFSRVVLINLRDFVHSEQEVQGGSHFDRMVYFRLFKFIEASLRAGEFRKPEPGWATHEVSDPQASLLECQDAHVLSRTSRFLLEDGKLDVAESLARRAIRLDPETRTHQAVYLDIALARDQPPDFRELVECLREEYLASGLAHRVGLMFYRSDDFIAAEHFFRLACAADPASFFHRHWLADALEELDRKQEAFDILGGCLADGDPDSRLQARMASLSAKFAQMADSKGLVTAIAS